MCVTTAAGAAAQSDAARAAGKLSDAMQPIFYDDAPHACASAAIRILTHPWSVLSTGPLAVHFAATVLALSSQGACGLEVTSTTVSLPQCNALLFDVLELALLAWPPWTISGP